MIVNKALLDLIAQQKKEAPMNTTPPADTLQAIVAQMREMERMLTGNGVVHIVSVAQWADRIEALAASAPTVDSLHEALRGLLYMWRTSEKNGERVTQFDNGYEQASDECADALETALNSLAASAQVREVEACDAWGLWNPTERRLANVLFPTKEMAEAHGRCDRGYIPTPLTAKPAAEPAPVAQGDAMRTLLINLDVLTIAPTGSTVLNENAKHVIREAHRAIADHARRESELKESLDTAIGVLDHSAETIEQLEASLAACRADAERFGIVIRSPDFTWDGRKWPQLDHDKLRAAIDALRQETT